MSRLSQLSIFISERRFCGKIYHDDFLRKSGVSFLRSDRLRQAAQRRPAARGRKEKPSLCRGNTDACADKGEQEPNPPPLSAVTIHSRKTTPLWP